MSNQVTTIDAKAQAIDKHIGQKLKHLRIMRGLSQRTLGQIVDVSLQQIHKYEDGSNSISSNKLSIFAEALKVPITYFFKQKHKHFVEGIVEQSSLSLLRAFNSIKDSEVKSNVLALVKTIASTS